MAESISSVEKITQHYPAVGQLFSAEEIAEVSHEYSPPLLAPDVLYAATVRRLEDSELTHEQQEACLEMASSLIQPDRLTGFDRLQYKDMNLALIQLHQDANPDAPPVHYMGADVSNLRGLNLALSGANIDDPNDTAITAEGRGRTDQVLKLFSAIMKDEVDQAVAHHSQHGDETLLANFYRDGGDELSAFVSGLSPQEMQQVQTGVHTQISQLVEKAGLSHIMHPKYPHLGERNGAGLACAYTEVTPDATLQDMGKLVDEKVEAVKEMRAAQNLVDSPQIQLTQEQIVHAMGVLQEEAASRGIDLEAREQPKPFPFAERDVLTQQLEGDFAPPVLRRNLQVENAIADMGMGKEGKNLLRGLHNMYEAHDNVTGYQRHSPHGVISEGIEYLRDNPDENMHVMVFEMQNFAGMNKELGHNGCNKVFGDLAHKIHMPTDDALYYRPEGQGDRLYVFTRDLDDAQVAQMAQQVVAMTDVYTAMNGLSDLENPRYPEEGYEGVRFIIGASRLRGEQTPSEVFQALDNQVRENKQQQKSFDGKCVDEPERVCGFGKARSGSPSMSEVAVTLHRAAPRHDTDAQKDSGKSR